MKTARFIPVVLFALFYALTAYADPPDAGEIQKILAAPEIEIGDLTLDHDGLNDFYTPRDDKPVWNFSGEENAAAFNAFLDSIEHLISYHGLPPEEYPIDAMHQFAAGAGSDNAVKLELLVTDTLLKLAHDLHGDSIDLGPIYTGWNFSRSDEDIPSDLAAAIAGGRLIGFINDLEPKNPAYAKLAQALKDYRDIAAKDDWPTVDIGGALRPGDRGKRVAQLRERLAVEGFTAQGKKTIFDDDLREILADWQSRHGLDGDGHAGPKTIEALNVPLSARIDQIRANMERWRHMPENFPPSRYALVNIPEATLVIVENGAAVYRGPVVVGRIDRETPFINSAIRSMIINPSWHVPKKIAQQDILPKLRKDPHYLEKQGFVIKGNAGDPHGTHIDWSSVQDDDFNFHLRQTPGDLNSLGRLKFDFDNAFAVYMHGTPHQELFKKDIRNFSSGCIRLRDPSQVAEILLASNKDPWNVDRIEAAIQTTQTHWIGFATPMPLYVLYWTVFTDEAGQLNFRNDVYGYDQSLIQALSEEVPVDKAKSPP